MESPKKAMDGLGERKRALDEQGARRYRSIEYNIREIKILGP